MKGTYNPVTRELIVTGEEIKDFKTIINQTLDDSDYWDTVVGLDGNMLYDINLFEYGEGYKLQYVNLVDDGIGGLECGDNYLLGYLIVIE